jgi:hypothetical protein
MCLRIRFSSRNLSLACYAFVTWVSDVYLGTRSRAAAPDKATLPRARCGRAASRTPISQRHPPSDRRNHGCLGVAHDPMEDWVLATPPWAPRKWPMTRSAPSLIAQKPQQLHCQPMAQLGVRCQPMPSYPNRCQPSQRGPGEPQWRPRMSLTSIEPTLWQSSSRPVRSTRPRVASPKAVSNPRHPARLRAICCRVPYPLPNALCEGCKDIILGRRRLRKLCWTLIHLPEAKFTGNALLRFDRWMPLSGWTPTIQARALRPVRIRWRSCGRNCRTSGVRLI